MEQERNEDETFRMRHWARASENYRPLRKAKDYLTEGTTKSQKIQKLAAYSMLCKWLLKVFSDNRKLILDYEQRVSHLRVMIKKEKALMKQVKRDVAEEKRPQHAQLKEDDADSSPDEPTHDISQSEATATSQEQSFVIKEPTQLFMGKKDETIGESVAEAIQDDADSAIQSKSSLAPNLMLFAKCDSVTYI